jgi:hypothetical protein
LPPKRLQFSLKRFVWTVYKSLRKDSI